MKNHYVRFDQSGQRIIIPGTVLVLYKGFLTNWLIKQLKNKPLSL